MRSLAAIGLLLVSSCRAAEPASPLVAPTKPAPIDLCKGAPPMDRARAHTGILRHARCDAEAHAIMTELSRDLGVGCDGCHAKSATDPAKLDLQARTGRKEIAQWMSALLMTSLKAVDGSEIRCRSCHVDSLGRPLLKILGDKRDPMHVNEWMSLVMARKFVAADGARLKCKSCHVGTPGTNEFRGKVLMMSEQLPKH